MIEKILTIFVTGAVAVLLFWIIAAITEIPVDNNTVWLGVCIIAAGALIREEDEK